MRKVHWKSRRSNNVSAMYLCTYVWIIERFTARNVRSSCSFNWGAGIRDICAPLSISNIILEFLSFMWKSQLESEFSTRSVDKDCCFICFTRSCAFCSLLTKTLVVVTYISPSFRHAAVLVWKNCYAAIFAIVDFFLGQITYLLSPVFGWCHHSKFVHLHFGYLGHDFPHFIPCMAQLIHW